MEAATFDVRSDGRFELGLGAGGSLPADYEQTGIPLDPPGTRVGRLAESLHIFMWDMEASSPVVARLSGQ